VKEMFLYLLKNFDDSILVYISDKLNVSYTDAYKIAITYFACLLSSGKVSLKDVTEDD